MKMMNIAKMVTSNLRNYFAIMFLLLALRITDDLALLRPNVEEVSCFWLTVFIFLHRETVLSSIANPKIDGWMGHPSDFCSSKIIRTNGKAAGVDVDKAIINTTNSIA